MTRFDRFRLAVARRIPMTTLASWVAPRWTQEELDDIKVRAHARWLALQPFIDYGDRAPPDQPPADDLWGGT